MSSDLAEGHDCNGWAARDESGLLSPFQFKRRAVGADDVKIKITHCGICYADRAFPRNKTGNAKYPMVPGHEIAGIVKEVGADVHGFKIGDHAGVGAYVNSCKSCEECEEGFEVYCSKGVVFTYNAADYDGTVTHGGFSNFIVVDTRYCYKIPEGYPLESAAPLLCAGITVYNPMIHHNMNQPGKSLGVVGLGGLGHMAVKFGKAFGLKVTVFSTSISKKDEALNVLDADNFVLSSDEQQMKNAEKSLNFIIDSASGDHPINRYLSMLKTGGVLVLVGFPGHEIKVSPLNLFFGQKAISGSATGGVKQTQQMLEFCAANNIYPKIEVIPIQYVNEALERMAKSDVRYRFVIDIGNSLN